jgi:hypothetical protein
MNSQHICDALRHILPFICPSTSHYAFQYPAWTVTPVAKAGIDRDRAPTLAALARYMRTLYLHVHPLHGHPTEPESGDAGT